VLTRDMLRGGLCSDLADSEQGRREFERRASEAALLLRAAGIPVKLEL
jgi:bifunctional enzyme CysN/CysC